MRLRIARRRAHPSDTDSCRTGHARKQFPLVAGTAAEFGAGRHHQQPDGGGNSLTGSRDADENRKADGCDSEGYNWQMRSASLRRNVTSRLIRRGDPVPEDRDWERLTPAQRIDAVWDLTLLCLAWNGGQPDEPRLQRSVSRVQRSRR